MTETTRDDAVVGSKLIVLQAARRFAETLAGSPQFREFEQSHFDYRQDTEAQSAIQAFQKKQASLKALLMLNAVDEEDRKELQRLQDQFCRQPCVLRYATAQKELTVACQDVGDQLSKAIGMDFGSSCRTGGCCG